MSDFEIDRKWWRIRIKLSHFLVKKISESSDIAECLMSAGGAALVAAGLLAAPIVALVAAFIKLELLLIKRLDTGSKFLKVHRCGFHKNPRRTSLLALLVTASLVGCASGPSEQQIEAARQMKAEQEKADQLLALKQKQEREQKHEWTGHIVSVQSGLTSYDAGGKSIVTKIEYYPEFYPETEERGYRLLIDENTKLINFKLEGAESNTSGSTSRNIGVYRVKGNLKDEKITATVVEFLHNVNKNR